MKLKGLHRSPTDRIEDMDLRLEVFIECLHHRNVPCRHIQLQLKRIQKDATPHYGFQGRGLVRVRMSPIDDRRESECKVCTVKVF